MKNLEQTIKILGISGSPIKGGNVEVLLKTCLDSISGKDGVTTKLITIAGKKIEDCNQCNWCMIKQTKEKICAKADDMNEIYPEVLEADGFLIGTPVYFARLSGHLACFLDRFRCITHGKYYHQVLENKVGGALAVSWFRNAGVETALLSINQFYFVQGIIPVGPPFGNGCQWGVAAYSSYDGSGKFRSDDRPLILKDTFGLTAGQRLSAKLVKICRIIKAGQEALKGATEGT